MNSLLVDQFIVTRNQTEAICAPLETEDYVVQPIVDVSPPKWHLGHTTWFFEEFFLSKIEGYKRFDENFAFVFNSYYENIGKRVLRTNRGNLSRPSVKQVYAYRDYVNEAVLRFLNEAKINSEQHNVLLIGINHEQQHQELLLTDIKYILGHNPLMPAYKDIDELVSEEQKTSWLSVAEDLYTIGFNNEGFCYDNELGKHQVFLNEFNICSRLVTNAEYAEFMKAGGYENVNYWHAEAWEWLQRNNIKAPMYWFEENQQWKRYALNGVETINWNIPVTHISYYEAFAFAQWRGLRLPTEFEWEVAQKRFNWGQVWEWTESSYLPYPNYTKAPGALGEYNGKFMVNQKVLRGASIATAKDHSRATYRNFFHPQLRWQFTGIRLVK